jgi:hypothetical protein
LRSGVCAGVSNVVEWDVVLTHLHPSPGPDARIDVDEEYACIADSNFMASLGVVCRDGSTWNYPVSDQIYSSEFGVVSAPQLSRCSRPRRT